MDQFLINKNANNKKVNLINLILEDETLLLIMDMQERILSNIEGNKIITFNIKSL